MFRTSRSPISFVLYRPNPPLFPPPPQVLNRIARINGKPEITEKLRASRVKRGSLLHLFHRNYWLLTIMQWYIWFACGFSYYGIVLVSAELPTTPHMCLQKPSTFSKPHISLTDHSCCQTLTSDSYVSILVSTVGEFLALPFNACLMSLVGRKITMGISSFVGTFSFFFLNFCAHPLVTNILLLITRFACQAVFTGAYVYTNEVYPTSIRVLGMGCCSAMARIGAMLTPFVAQVLLPLHSVLAATSIYSGVLALTGIFCFLLPVETKGRPLPQTVEDEPEKSASMSAADGKNYETFKEK